MPKEKIEAAIKGAEDEIVGVVKDFVSLRKKEYTKLALEYRDRLEQDLVNYASLLADGKLTEDEATALAKIKSDGYQAEVLATASVSKTKFGKLVEKILGILLRTAFKAALAAL